MSCGVEQMRVHGPAKLLVQIHVRHKLLPMSQCRISAEKSAESSALLRLGSKDTVMHPLRGPLRGAAAAAASKRKTFVWLICAVAGNGTSHVQRVDINQPV